MFTRRGPLRNTMNIQHTPGKLYIESNQFTIWSESSQRAVASVYGTNSPEPMATEARANAARLIRAWNCHDELLADLQQAIGMLEAFHKERPEGEGLAFPVMHRFRTTIAKAQEPSP